MKEQKDSAVVVVNKNKLKLSSSAITLLKAKTGDRITINYWTVSPEETFPVIAKSEVFGEPSNGNRLTKSNTVSYRGVQHEVLLQYGSSFELESFKAYFKLVPIESSINEDFSEERTALEKLNEEI